ncbi:hypothetical protein GCM10010112_87150 [Actinoplanes lobatus]|uniref:DUF3168 domain-containing protein n=1 Tax=Actinoplanes lobatus TaxID=113568 RepID=A0A7W7MFA8_9ACTN|nr:hypothetical protein [Actinoplanes lobatus]MBB4747750.1 hypothetical protein [Actinoplanes lobatus]GGN96154.1 hypothetical protein GCM10010112_87150 [Actinoplanes lobatus]GIE45179.1 hypothetical protein Alo02nite_80770 [Actinoplanes lobatus]
MDYSAIAAGLAAAAAGCTYPGPDGTPRHLLAHGWAPEHVDPPSFEVGEIAIDGDQSFSDDTGSAIETGLITCRVYVARSGAAEAAHELLRLLLRSHGPSSIKAALEADRTLGGVVDALVVERRTGYGMYDVAGVTYYGARFEVRVWGRSG